MSTASHPTPSHRPTVRRRAAPVPPVEGATPAYTEDEVKRAVSFVDALNYVSPEHAQEVLRRYDAKRRGIRRGPVVECASLRRYATAGDVLASLTFDPTAPVATVRRRR